MSEPRPIDAIARTARWKRRLALLCCGLIVLALCLALRYTAGPDQASAEGEPQPPAADASQSATTAAPAETPQIVAVVNGEPISRRQLAQECLWHYGDNVLENLVNKRLIADECRARNITVTNEEVQAELARMAERFGVPVEQWLKMLQQERNISPEAYAADIIWPTVALRKLADARLVVTDQELQEAYERQFGAAVQCRLISCGDQSKAQKLRAMALANPDDFGNLAKQYSEDPNSASARGLIQPIRKHLGDPNIEQVAFALQPGAISELVAVGDQFVILKCESHLPPRRVPLDQVRKPLTDAIRDKKLRLASSEIFDEMLGRSRVENVFADAEKSQREPTVAARINGRVITVDELAEECIRRHGVEVLEGVISRAVLKQACHARSIGIGRTDLDAEIARAAVSMGKTKPDQPAEADLEAWLAEVTRESGMSAELYMHATVWPTVALKRLVEATVEISDEDLQKGFEANYGPQVRCRAIVLNSLRQAQQVWEMARENPDIEHFGNLAEEYSIEGSSRSLRGEVPPIQRWGGQPELEREAFSLEPGELSGIVQVGDKFIIMLCEGYTDPINVEFEEVRELIRADVAEKKLRVAMSQEYSRLMDEAQIDNMLAGTSQPGKRAASLSRAETAREAAAGATR